MYLITPNGEWVRLSPTSDTAYTREELQELVQGSIDVRSLPAPFADALMVLNSRIQGQPMPVNHVASELAGQVVVGKVAVIRKAEWS